MHWWKLYKSLAINCRLPFWALPLHFIPRWHLNNYFSAVLNLSLDRPKRPAEIYCPSAAQCHLNISGWYFHLINRAESQGQAEVGDTRRILSEMRDVQKSVLRLGLSPGDVEQQQQHPHPQQFSAFSLLLWHYGSFGGFISIRAHLHLEWQSSIQPGAFQRKGCSHIDNKQKVGGGRHLLWWQMNIWILGDFSMHFDVFVTFTHSWKQLSEAAN